MTDITAPEASQEMPHVDFLEKFRTLEADSPWRTECVEVLMRTDAHYGHQRRSQNPKVSKYIYGTHGDVHVINLTYTIFLLKKVLNYLVSLFSENNARILFVGSKEQLVDVIQDSAERCGQYYVNHRWFGGTLTNWKTIQQSIRKIDMIERDIDEENFANKKELQSKTRVHSKLIRSLGGIRRMSSLPDCIFVCDTKRESVAIAEANKLGIPVIALIDSNSNPDGVDYCIPCNDDSQATVSLITRLIGDAVLVGMEACFAKKESQQKDRDSNRRSYENRKNYIRNDQKDQSGNRNMDRNDQRNDQRRPEQSKEYTKPETNN